MKFRAAVYIGSYGVRVFEDRCIDGPRRHRVSRTLRAKNANVARTERHERRVSRHESVPKSRSSSKLDGNAVYKKAPWLRAWDRMDGTKAPLDVTVNIAYLWE